MTRSRPTDPPAADHDPWSGFTGWADAEATEDTRTESAVRRFVRRFSSQRLAMVALVAIGFLVAVAAFAPWVVPHDPLAQNLSRALEAPSATYWFGTDAVGRDTLSRMVFGARLSLLAAAEAVTVALVLGVVPGLVAGFFGGWVDIVLSRITDAVMRIPPLILAIAIVGVFGPNLRNAMFAVGVIFAPRFLRLTRSAVMAVREETYIEASRSIGTSTGAVLRRHVLPNILSPLIVQISLSMGFAMLAEASLSFLGLGVQPPQASWGAMVGTGYRFLDLAPHMVLIPGFAIVLAVLAFNVLGDGLRDSFGREERAADR
ncbi:MAG: ABC transporter permease subunit [Pseudonocardiaceae bacterium]|nr:ABC transporter permease subunit [Pseudonocardiaceae bacterium]